MHYTSKDYPSRLVNCTPHKIVLNDGTEFEPSGIVARVSATFQKAEPLFGKVDINPDIQYTRTVECQIFEETFGEIVGLPEPDVHCRGGADWHEHNVYCGCDHWDQAPAVFVVSAIVLKAAKAAGREDCVAPATGHPDCIRIKEGPNKGQIISVPGFVR